MHNCEIERLSNFEPLWPDLFPGALSYSFYHSFPDQFSSETRDKEIGMFNPTQSGGKSIFAAAKVIM